MVVNPAYSIAKELDENEINKIFDELLKHCHLSKTQEERTLIRKAFNFARKAHEGAIRYSGELYIKHPLEVARIVAESMGLDTTSVVCALLHDIVQETEYTIDDLKDLFGEKISIILDGISRIKKDVDYKDNKQGESFRKILLTLSDDIRVIFVKLADRLHNLRTIEYLIPEKQIKSIHEALFVYAPLAQWLGLYNIKNEMEDLCLRYTHPQIYYEIKEKLKINERKRTQFINKFSLPIINVLTEEKIVFEISGRPKSIYSIWNKMQNKKVTFDEVYDLFAIRIIFKPNHPQKEIDECWRIYSIITKMYPTKSDRLRDWVSKPKSTGYEALHITVMGPDNRWVEVQIRSERMNEIAEVGFAAHSLYKGITDKATSVDKQLQMIRHKIESASENIDEFFDQFQLKVLSSEILVYTPKGDIITLPKGATVIDFAFAIHSDLAFHCIGAKINYKLVPVNYVLQSGDEVEILTSTSQTPKIKWLNFVKTERAKTKIKENFKERRRVDIGKGKLILDNILKELNVIPNSILFKDLKKQFNFLSKEHFYHLIGIGSIREDNLIEEIRKKMTTKVINYWDVQFLQPEKITDDDLAKKMKNLFKQIKNKPEINFVNCKCCQPKPSDEIFGFFDKDNNGNVLVHTLDCKRLSKKQTIPLEWFSVKSNSFLVKLKISGLEKPEVFGKLSTLVNTNTKIHINNFCFETDGSLFTCKFIFFIPDTISLDKIIDDIKSINGVKSVTKLEIN